jgi:hypothetical protein
VNRTVPALALILALSLVQPVTAQSSGPGGPGGGGFGGQGGMGGRGGQGGAHGGNPLIGPPSDGPRGLDPEAHDAIDLFSHLCVSTRGDRNRVVSIVGDGDTAIEKMDEPLLRGLENGKSGGLGWIVRMPLGEKLLVDLPADGACLVRAPRVDPAALESAFHALLDQFAASGQFTVRREGDQTQVIGPDGKPSNDTLSSGSGGDGRGPGVDNRLRYHLMVYRMQLPDTGKAAELGLATTASRSVSIQATLSFEIHAEKP